MAFSIGNGLSRMGSAIATTAGSMALEQQRADLDNQKIALADQLAGAREHAGRLETADLNLRNTKEQDTFTASQADLDRKARKAETDAANATHLRAANISAGAAIAVEQLRLSEGVAATDDQGFAVIVHPNTGQVTPMLRDGKPVKLDDKQARATNALVLDANNDALMRTNTELATAQNNLDTLRKVQGSDPGDVKAAQDLVNSIHARARALQKQNDQLRAALAPPSPAQPAAAPAAAPAKPPLSAFRLQPPALVTGQPDQGDTGATSLSGLVH